MSITTSGPGKIADDIIHLLEERGTGDYIGESTSQLEHSLQAANFAVQAGERKTSFKVHLGRFNMQERK
jgi:predicted HD phosphohydrolase